MFKGNLIQPFFNNSETLLQQVKPWTIWWGSAQTKINSGKKIVCAIKKEKKNLTSKASSFNPF